MKANTFPFGTKSTKVEQKDKSPKKVFILSDYPTGVTADWIDPHGNTRIKSLEIANEPRPFWEGENAEEIVNNISLDPKLGKLVPSSLNGQTGSVFVRDYLKSSYEFEREDIWYSYLIPYHTINPQKAHELKSKYDLLAESHLLPHYSMPTFNPGDFKNKQRVSEILKEIRQSGAETIICLGDLTGKHFLSHFTNVKKMTEPYSDFDNDYGKPRFIKIDGKTYKIYHFFHPRELCENNKERHLIYHKENLNILMFFKALKSQYYWVIYQKDFTKVKKKPGACPVCACRKIATFSYDKPEPTKLVKRNLKKGTLIMREKDSLNDSPDFMCTFCKQDFFLC